VSDKPWNPEVERIRKAMMERFSDKLSMEEIAEFAYSVAVECTAPAPQTDADYMRGFLDGQKGAINAIAAASPTFTQIMKEYAAAPQVTPWKSHFTDSDVTGDTHNYVDTGDGKRLWAQDADEIVKRHNEQASPTPDKCPRCDSKDYWTALPACHGGIADSWHSSAATQKGTTKVGEVERG
jgi:hypothetical protein